MDNTTERETHDFKNVESFSQLPFIRPARPALKEKGIRLFGIEFGNGGGDKSTATDESESAETTTNNTYDLDSTKDNNSNIDNGESSSRRFECHYCCRNFPTSQALGGHQNAHKRERQHAKRQHLQYATMVPGNGNGSSLSDAHVYGNHRFSSSMPYNPASWHSNSSISSSSAMITSTSGGGGRFYGTSYYSHYYQQQQQRQQQQQQPINGSPLALWQTPAVQSNNPTFNRDRSLLQYPSPLFSGEEVNLMMRASQVGASGSQNRYGCDSKTSVHDQVSLDLHL